MSTAYKVVSVSLDGSWKSSTVRDVAQRTYRLDEETLGVTGPLFFFDSLVSAVGFPLNPLGPLFKILECRVEDVVETPHLLPMPFSPAADYIKFWAGYFRNSCDVDELTLSPPFDNIVLAWSCTPFRVVGHNEITDALVALGRA